MNYIKPDPMQCFTNCYKAAVQQSTEVPVTKTDVAATEQKTKKTVFSMVYLNRKCQKLSQNVVNIPDSRYHTEGEATVLGSLMKWRLSISAHTQYKSRE